jgi:hydrogenase nickel incorporation protein HypB
MCLDCGCALSGPARIDGHPSSLLRIELPRTATRTIPVHADLLAPNVRAAAANRARWRALGLLTINVVSSPGAGKTTLLSRTIERLAPALASGVVVGDLETDNDARRLRATGAPAVQIATGTLCHLDAQLVAEAADGLPLADLDLLIIENIGNLVCPADFDLGEDLRVTLLAVTEGEDKPLKYPPIYRNADVVLITKTDLAQACAFDRDAAMASIRAVNPHATVIELSSRDGAGMDAWCDLLRARMPLATR